MRALALAVLMMPAVALAQQPLGPPAPPPPPAPPVAAPAAPEPSECVTTTTTRCTGAAAPYAVQAAQPQTVIVPVPAPAPPPVVAPPPAPVAPTPILLDPRALGGGWKLVQSPDGCIWKERKISTDSPGVWGTGLAVFVGSWLAGAIGGQANDNPLGWWPVIGPMVSASFTHDGEQVLWAVDGVAQAAGFVTMLVGFAAGPDKVERMPLTVGPIALVGGGSGVAVGGRF